MQFAGVNGVTLHYQVISAAAGKPSIVFVNSLGTDFRIWRDVVVRLAGDFGVLLYDQRGHGLSDVGATPYSIETLADDLAALIRHAGAGPAIVCAMSVGGLVAQALYARHPGLVTGLVLCDTAARIGTAEGWSERIRRVEAAGIDSVADGVVQGWFTPAFCATSEYAGYRNMLVRQPIEGYLATVGVLRDTDLSDLAPRIAVPTVCLVGDGDAATPPAAVAALAKMIPGARYEIIRDAGHLPPIEHPAAVAEIIRALSSMVERANGQQRH